MSERQVATRLIAEMMMARQLVDTIPQAMRLAPKKMRRVIHRTATAAEMIGHLEPGVHVTGLTAGQVSSADVMEHMVNEIGPASVRISARATGMYDTHRAREIRTAGGITDIRLLLDRGTFERSPKFAAPLIGD